MKYVRLTLRSPMAAGSDYVDFSELEVYGAPPNQLPAGSLAASRMRLTAGGTVDFAASFTDPDSRIVGYDWDFDGDGAVDRSTAEPSTSFTYSRAGRLRRLGGGPRLPRRRRQRVARDHRHAETRGPW